eukprot:150780-Chlamydomonas_euryale.AAC.1
MWRLLRPLLPPEKAVQQSQQQLQRRKESQCVAATAADEQPEGRTGLIPPTKTHPPGFVPPRIATPPHKPQPYLDQANRC